MVTKSMKRIVWSLGYLFVWAINDFYIYLLYGTTYKYSTALALFNLAILIIPLFMFEDDKNQKEKFK